MQTTFKAKKNAMRNASTKLYIYLFKINFKKLEFIF